MPPRFQTKRSPRPSASSPLLAPAVLAKIGRLELAAHQVMDGYVQGMHRSSQLGFALDFAQHRPYTVGDDTKRIDWRLFAKSDRYYIKQYEVTTNLHAYIILDCSGSMAYRGQNEPMSKYRYGQYLTSCLAYLVLHQQDSCGLFTVDNAIRDVIPSRSTPSHLLTIVDTLEQRQPGAESGLAGVLHRIAERLTRRAMVIIISDLFENTDELVQALHHFRHRRHELLLLHVMAEDELTFPFRKWTLFNDLEVKGKQLRLDPAVMRRQYLDAVAEHLHIIRKTAGELRISHTLLSTARPFDQALTAYLAQRMEERGL
jgi:uncharacterized protein (DUF58 family)